MDTWRVSFNLVTFAKLSRSLLTSLKWPSYTGLEFQMVGSEGGGGHLFSLKIKFIFIC